MDANSLTNPAQMPQSTSMAMPDMSMTAGVANDSGWTIGAPMTPASLSQPLPNIVQSAPAEIAQCDAFTQWVADNPLLAGGLLVGLALLMWRK